MDNYVDKKARFWTLLKNYLDSKHSLNSETGSLTTADPWIKRIQHSVDQDTEYVIGDGRVRPPVPHINSISVKGPSRYSPTGRSLLPNNHMLRPSLTTSSPTTSLDPYRQWIQNAGVYVTRSTHLPSYTSSTTETWIKTLSSNSGTQSSTPVVPKYYSPSITTSKGLIDADSMDESSFITSSVASNSSSMLFNISSECGLDIVEDSKYVYLYGVALLVTLSILCNGVSFGVFNTKVLRRFAFSSYMAALALSDTLALLSQLPRLWMSILYEALGWQQFMTLYDEDEIACKSFTFISYVFRFLSAWLTVAITVERAIVAVQPFRKSNFSKRNSAYRMTLYILIISLLINSHVIFTWKTMDIGDEVRSCSPNLPSESVTFSVTVLTVTLIIGLPFTVTLIMTILLIKGLASRRWQLRPQRMTQNALFRLELERRACIMVAMVTTTHCVLSIPYVLTWCVLLAQPWIPGISVCHRLAASAAKDVTEVVFMFNYTVKLILCAFGGSNLLSMK